MRAHVRTSTQATQHQYAPQRRPLDGLVSHGNSVRDRNSVRQGQCGQSPIDVFRHGSGDDTDHRQQRGLHFLRPGLRRGCLQLSTRSSSSIAPIFLIPGTTCSLWGLGALWRECALTVLFDMVKYIHGRTAAHGVVHSTGEASTDWYSIPPAVSLSPAVPFCTRVYGGMAPTWAACICSVEFTGLPCSPDLEVSGIQGLGIICFADIHIRVPVCTRNVWNGGKHQHRSKLMPGRARGYPRRNHRT